MKKLESSLINMLLVLVSVAVISGALLAWVNHVTAEPVRVQEELTLANGIKKVMGTELLTVVSDDTLKATFDNKEFSFVVHKTNDANEQFIGAAIESTTLGFGGDMKILVGFDKKGELTGYTVLQHAETPGLGAKADTWFQEGGKGCIVGRQLDVNAPLTVNKDGGDVDAITASTITSRAFLKAINNAYAVYARQDADHKKEVDAHTGATKKHE